MMTQTGREEQINQIRIFPQILEEMIADLSESQLETPEREGEWTVRQIVHHLADAHINGFVRMKLVATEIKPILKPYDQDAWALLADISAPLESSLLILRGLHQRWASFLEGLPETAWDRAGIHLESGLVTMEDLLNLYTRHSNVHLEQINKTINRPSA